MIATLTSRRLWLRPWTLDDVDAAFEIHSHDEVARWLSPAMDAVRDRSAMRLVLQQWVAENHRNPPPTGRWAIELTDQHRVIGGMTILYLPPGGMDLEIGWQLAPEAWGNGYAAEAGHTLAHWALEYPGIDEVFAVVRPANTRGAATANRIGMEWVGETDKYYDLELQVYRLRAADLDRPLADQQYGADQHH
ncbi:MAG TPA: GNAT family N-acetyltransferase [Pseudonocardiaceae bacterium]|nr:GNAT family N-acetyltransferase [Pseudonocardiaceae bacterium]